MHSKKCRSAVFVILHPKGVAMGPWHITLPIRGHMIRFHATATPSNCRNKGEMSAIWFTKRIAQKTNPCNKPLRMYRMELSYDHQIKKHNNTTVLLQAVITLSYSALTHSYYFILFLEPRQVFWLSKLHQHLAIACQESTSNTNNSNDLSLLAGLCTSLKSWSLAKISSTYTSVKIIFHSCCLV